jgi:antitoxin (DNA-binding transcriptional repressor) of toxin-antitoxin stability system
LAEAQARLPELIASLAPGEELGNIQNGATIARLERVQPASDLLPRQPGSAKGKFFIHEEDDAHLEHFREYMP